MAWHEVRVTPRSVLTSGSEVAESLNIEPASCANLRQWIYWPQRCPCCGGESDAHTDIRWGRGRASGSATGGTWYSIRVPYCQRCLDHAKVAAGASRAALIAGLLVSLALFIPATVIFSRRASSAVTLLAVLTASVGGGCLAALGTYRSYNATRVRPTLRQGCSSPYMAVDSGGCEGNMHSFLFRSGEYAQDFAQMNGAEGIQEYAA